MGFRVLGHISCVFLGENRQSLGLFVAVLPAGEPTCGAPQQQRVTRSAARARG